MSDNEFTLLGVAKAVSADIEEFGTHRLGSFLTWAKRGYRELKLSSLMNTVTEEIPLNSYHAIDIPEDCLAWTAVGIRYGDKVLCLGTAEDIALFHEKDDCGSNIDNPHSISINETINGISPESYMPFWFGGWYGGSVPGQSAEDPTTFCGYHSGKNYKGYFNWDRENRQLQFSSNVHVKTILLQQIKDGSSCDENTCIEPIIFKYLVAYVHEKRVRHRKDESESTKDGYASDLHYAHLEVKHMTNPLRKEDIVNAARQGYRLSPRTN